jgi:hypothetical protein
LGHITPKEGIEMDLEKIETIKGWITPQNVTEFRSFMGLAGYYSRFIAGFSKIAHPITSLQRKGNKFQWTKDCEKSFQQLKQLLTGAPILKIIDPNEDFMVCIYVYKEGLGGVLSQNGFVICFESKKLKEHEKLYATHDLELATIVHALKKWRHYLMGKRFELRTYHNGLEYLFDQPTLNVRQSRGLESLCEYDFHIKHVKGKENKVVDGLSKRVNELHATSISTYQTDLKGISSEAAKEDLKYMELVTKLQQGKMQPKVEDYELGFDGILLYINRVYVPNSFDLRNVILKEMHNVPYAGHPVYQKTISAVKSQYYWPGMKREIVDFIVKCLECQRVKVEHRHLAGLWQPLPILEWKWEVVTMDFIIGLSRTNKQHGVITLNFSTHAYLAFGPLTCIFLQSIVELLF